MLSTMEGGMVTRMAEDHTGIPTVLFHTVIPIIIIITMT